MKLHAHLFISVDIQLGCILDPEDGVSMRESSYLDLDSDGIVNQLTKRMSCTFQEDLKQSIETILEVSSCSHRILSKQLALLFKKHCLHIIISQYGAILSG